MAPRLLLVSQQVRSVRSGVGTYARVLLDGLARRDTDLTVATWTHEVDRESFPEVRWIDLGRQPSWDPTPGAFWTLGRRVARALSSMGGSGFELVHFLDAREGHAWLARGRGQRAVVGTVHDDYAVHAPCNPLGLIGRAADPLRRWIYYRWLAHLEHVSYRYFDLLMVNSTATGESIVDHYGVAEERTRLVHLCVPPPPAVMEPEALAGRPALVFAGGNFYRKGLDVVVRSVALLSARLPDVRLHVVGHDRAWRRIAALARRIGVGDTVKFHGRVAAARMAAMIAGADVLVMPSRREALGLVYLEAFRASVPVIASHAGGVTDLVLDRESGLCVPPEDPPAIARAIVELAEDERFRARLADGGRRILAERTPKRLLAETLAAYDEVARAGSGRVAGDLPRALAGTTGSAGA